MYFIRLPSDLPPRVIIRLDGNKFSVRCTSPNFDHFTVNIGQVVVFFVYVSKHLKLSVGTFEIYRSALDHTFTLAGYELLHYAHVISEMMKSFHVCRPLPIHRFSIWNLALVLDSFRRPSFEPSATSDKTLN